MFHAMHAMLTKGDTVVVQWPAHQAFVEVALDIQARLLLWTPATRPDGSLDFEVSTLRAIMGASSPAFSPKLLIMSCPNNPTGWLPSREDHAEIVEICKRHGSYLFSDESQRGLEYLPNTSLPAAADVYDLAISLGSLDPLGLSGLNIGWMVSRSICLMKRIADLLDYTSPVGNQPSQVLALIAVRAREQLLHRSRLLIKTNLGALQSFCNKHSNVMTWFDSPTLSCIGCISQEF